MIFNLERPIADQLLDSILEHPEEWETVLVSGNPCKHRHKNGVELWIQNEITGNVAIWEPASCKAIEFTEEEKRRLHKAVIQIRKETDAQRLADAKNTFVQLMNKGKTPPRNWNVVHPKDSEDPINYFNKVAWAGTALIVIAICLSILAYYLGI